MSNMNEKIKHKPYNLFYNSRVTYNEPKFSMEQINFDVSETSLGADIFNEKESKFKTNFLMYNNEPYPFSKPKNQIINTKSNFDINFLVEDFQMNKFENKNIITISNLPKIISERKLKEIFSSFGNILNLYKNETYAEIHYLYLDQALNSIKNADGLNLFGKNITVKLKVEQNG